MPKIKGSSKVNIHHGEAPIEIEANGYPRRIHRGWIQTDGKAAAAGEQEPRECDGRCGYGCQRQEEKAA